MSRFIDLSHPIEAGMTTYPGMPVPRLSTYVSRRETADRLSDGVSFHIAGIEMVANTGTYLDAPFHFHEDGPDVADLTVERLVDVPVTVVRATGHARVGAERFGDPGRLWGQAVLVETGWSRHWGTSAYLSGSPFLTADAARLLVEANVALVGIDALNIDDVDDPRRPVHQGLLGAGIPILEHLCGLSGLPDTGARLTALPPPVRGMGTFPVRAVARLS